MIYLLRHSELIVVAWQTYCYDRMNLLLCESCAVTVNIALYGTGGFPPFYANS